VSIQLLDANRFVIRVERFGFYAKPRPTELALRIIQVVSSSVGWEPTLSTAQQNLTKVDSFYIHPIRFTGTKKLMQTKRAFQFSTALFLIPTFEFAIAMIIVLYNA
jgi:hypothetical protein